VLLTRRSYHGVDAAHDGGGGAVAVAPMLAVLGACGDVGFQLVSAMGALPWPFLQTKRPAWKRPSQAAAPPPGGVGWRALMVRAGLGCGWQVSLPLRQPFTLVSSGADRLEEGWAVAPELVAAWEGLGQAEALYHLP
jgi:hypothetical protein